MRSELQKAALEALIEVRRETLNRAFANGSMKMTDEVGRMLALERQLEESQVRGRKAGGAGHRVWQLGPWAPGWATEIRTAGGGQWPLSFLAQLESLSTRAIGRQQFC